MCYCNPNVRTPCCGGPDCYPKDQEGGSENTHEILLKQSQLALWQSYCSKKQECEVLRDKLELALQMLEYSHTKSGTYCDYVVAHEFITDTNNFLKEKSNG